jgi:hypothetical protein
MKDADAGDLFVSRQQQRPPQSATPEHDLELAECGIALLEAGVFTRKVVSKLRSFLHLAAGSADAEAAGRAAMPMVEGKPVKLEMRITNRFWELDVRRAAADLARQSAGALDAPLRLDLVVRPGQLKDGELSMEVLKRGDDG